MVLDYSGSMKDNNKYKRMAAAATTMVDSLSSSIDEGHLKMGLVPFSAMVHTSMPSSYVTQWSANQRRGPDARRIGRSPYNITVDTPQILPTPDTKWGYYDNTSENSDELFMLAPIRASISSILAADGGHGSGEDEARRACSRWAIPTFRWAPSSAGTCSIRQNHIPKASPMTNKKTHKYLILLTDGVQTSKQWGPGNSRSEQNGNDNLPKICKGMADCRYHRLHGGLRHYRPQGDDAAEELRRRPLL